MGQRWLTMESIGEREVGTGRAMRMGQRPMWREGGNLWWKKRNHGTDKEERNKKTEMPFSAHMYIYIENCLMCRRVAVHA
jgi:hypothetical protein